MNLRQKLAETEWMKQIQAAIQKIRIQTGMWMANAKALGDVEDGEEVLKELQTNRLAKKTTIFIAVFALTCILWGNHMLPGEGEEQSLKTAMPAGPVFDAQVSGQAESPHGEAAGKPFREVDPAVAVSLPEFPFSGEYPSAVDSPLEAKPLIETYLPTPDGFVYTDSIPLSLDLQKYTYTRCVERSLEYELVLALMWRESRFQVDAVNVNTNGTQDSGIMQINDVNKGWLKEEHGIVDLMDPKQNIDAGTIMLGDFTRKYGVHDGLMAYQYGEQGMRQKLQQGVVTNDKIALLIDKRDDFRKLLQAA